MNHGLLLINLGTPDNPDVPSIKRYLSEFLMDRRVIDLPSFIRYLLLHTIILPQRARKATHAYQTIWTASGSPLRSHSEQLCVALQQKLSESGYKVVLGMRYGNPSIEGALKALESCEHITVLPLFPQYSSAATGSAIEKVLTLYRKKTVFPSLRIIRDFYSHPSFIKAEVAIIKPYVAHHDYILFSYHGLPQHHLLQSGCNNNCQSLCPPPSSKASNQACYRAQCLQTTTLIAKALNLDEKQFGSGFQSRLGKTPWIKPYTDVLLKELAAQGIKRLAIACPSFVADCLETLEEIQIGCQKQWMTLGGETLTLIPSLNTHPLWVDAIANMIVEQGTTTCT